MLLLKHIYNWIKTFDEICKRDKRITSHPLLGSPWPMFGIIALYLLFVLKWGPKLMANRKPFKVDGLMKIYNVIQILLNAFITYEATKYFILRKDINLMCQKYDPNDTSPETMKLVRPTILYFVSKYLDLFDTIFFVLRKKFNQVSFLHVYHHALMIIAVYIYCVFVFASHFSSTGILNGFVHVCMYTYYLVAALKPGGINLEAWRRNITRLQLLQFILITILIGAPLLNNVCGLPVHWLLVTFLQNVFMIVLFSNFYYKNYTLKDLKKRKLSSPNVLE